MLVFRLHGAPLLLAIATAVLAPHASAQEQSDDSVAETLDGGPAEQPLGPPQPPSPDEPKSKDKGCECAAIGVPAPRDPGAPLLLLAASLAAVARRRKPR